MSLTILLAVIALLIIILKSLVLWLTQLLKLPPGPVPIPFYGNRMPEDVHPGLCSWYGKLRKEYGNVFTVYRGTKPTVVVNGYKAVTELLITNGSIVHTRPSGEGILSFLHDDAGLVWNNKSYKAMRKISSIALKSFINAFNSAESTSTSRKSLPLRDELGEKLEFVADLSAPIRDLVSKNICTMIFGMQNQEKFAKVMALHYGSLSAVSKVDNVMRIPLLKYIPGFSKNWKNSIAGKKLFQDFLREELEEHSREYPSEETCDDFFDIFIRHNRTHKAGQLEEEDCFATVMQLILAGLDAVNGTLMWLFLYITINPAVQERMAEEIISEIGLECTPTSKHMSATPYCMAVIQETLRVSNVAFTSLPYTNQQDIMIGNTHIPANSSIIVNLVSVNKDPLSFSQPDAFIPERFLDKDGKLKNIPEFSPFSIGRRACLGESFSKSGVFIEMVKMLQQYRLCPVKGEAYSTESAKSFLSIPPPYKLKFVSRKTSS